MRSTLSRLLLWVLTINQQHNVVVPRPPLTIFQCLTAQHRQKKSPTQLQSRACRESSKLTRNMASMKDEEFREHVESGKLAVDRHDLLLRIALIYLDKGHRGAPWVFDTMEKLHSRGWSFGKGNLRFNRYAALTRKRSPVD